MPLSTPPEGEWLSSSGSATSEARNPPEGTMDNQAPKHPVPTMQGPFEESMMETMAEIDEPEPDNRYSRANSVSRRKMLLEQDKYERMVAGKWKQKPGEKFHPLWKLVAQISFGMHLLHQRLAKSDDEVIKILQSHVDEIDGFLERTTEDFDLAQKDIDERISYLQLPLKHSEVFDNMLDDKKFRMAIVEGNEKIEHIVDRTMAAMKDALKDVQKGLDATRELGRFLMRLENEWDNRTEEHASVYHAMVGNTEGWSRAFMTLQQKGSTLGVALVQLNGIIGEIQRRAGMASRRNVVALRNTEEKFNQESRVTSPLHPRSPPDTPKKSLPRNPNAEEVRKGVRPEREAKLVSQDDAYHVSEQDLKQTLKSNARLKLQGKAAKDLLASRTKGSTNDDAPSTYADPERQGSLLNPQPSSQTPSRRVSFAERTRSITRKIPFMKDSSDTRGSSPLLGISPDISGTMSPDSEARTPRSSRSIRLETRNEPIPDRKPKFKPIDSHILDGARIVLPATLSPLSSPKSGSPPQITGHIVKTTTGRPKVVTIREPSDRSINRSQLAAKEPQSMEVRLSNTVPGSPKKPATRDLPLRHYRSQEALSPPVLKASQLSDISKDLRRSSSMQVSPAKKAAPVTGSSIYSPEGQSSSVYPSEGLQTGEPSSTTYQSSGQSSEPASAAKLGPPTQSSSVYSPEGPASSAYIIPLSPYTSILSPPPAQSSATPSPLHIGSKTAAAAPKSAPIIPNEKAESDIAPTVISSIANRPSTPPEVLTSATVSGPEPDINPYAYSRSDTDTPLSKRNLIAPASTSDHKEAVSISPTFSPPTVSSFSPFPSPRTTAFPHAPQYPQNLSIFPTVPIVSAGGVLVPHTLAPTNEELDKGLKSPWKKVFGNGIGMSLGSKKGHRRSRSEQKLVGMTVGVVDARPRSSGQKRVASDGKKRKESEPGHGHGFMGGGRDGVWISRKNFMKT